MASYYNFYLKNFADYVLRTTLIMDTFKKKKLELICKWNFQMQRKKNYEN